MTDSYNYSYLVGMMRPQTFDEVDRTGAQMEAIECAIERLLRLYASRKVHARRAAAAGVVISQPGFSLLRRLREEGELTLGELARLTQMDPAATGRQIRLLEEEGLVMRGEGFGRRSGDRRRSHVEGGRGPAAIGRGRGEPHVRRLR